MGFRINHYESVANRKVSHPEPFAWVSWEFLDDGSTLLEGAEIVGTYERGPRKGKPKYAETRTRCVVTSDEVLAERARYERETGQCSVCGGDGQEWRGWNHITGHRFAPCRRCDASGRAAVQARGEG